MIYILQTNCQNVQTSL